MVFPHTTQSITAVIQLLFKLGGGGDTVIGALKKKLTIMLILMYAAHLNLFVSAPDNV